MLLEPGNRKSSVFTDAMKPLREIESELRKDAMPIVARALSERRQDETRLQKLEKIAASGDDPEAREEAGSLAEELEKQKLPVLPQLIVDDSTAEKLAIILSEQGARIASMSCGC